MTAPRPTAAQAMAYDKAEFMSKMGLEQSPDGSQTAFVSAREHAWHGLGTVLPGDFTIAQAMEFGHLGGWNVRKLPLTAHELTDEGVRYVEVPDRFAIVRDNPFEAGKVDSFGVVGNQYTPVQNEAHGEFLAQLTGSGGAFLETVGALQGGRRVFFSMKMPETMLVGGVDAVDMYLVAQNYHDGSGSFSAMVTPIRPVCQNTLNAAVAGATNKFKIRHTSGVEGAIARAREALDLTFAYAEAFQAEADRMIDAELATKDFRAILEQLMPLPAKAKDGGLTKVRHTQRLERILILSTDSPTLQQTKGTRWGAFQAITEYFDHYAPTTGAWGKRPDELVRAERVALGEWDEIKTRAFAALSV